MTRIGPIEKKELRLYATRQFTGMTDSFRPINTFRELNPSVSGSLYKQKPSFTYFHGIYPRRHCLSALATGVMKRFYVIFSLWRLCWRSLGFFFRNPLLADDIVCTFLELVIRRSGTGPSGNWCLCAVGCNMSRCIYRVDMYRLVNNARYVD